MQLKAKTLKRLDSINTEDDTDTHAHTTGLRRRKMSKSEDKHTDIQLVKRSTSTKETTNNDNDDQQTHDIHEDEEEVYTGNVSLDFISCV